jgi:hypothetical protein
MPSHTPSCEWPCCESEPLSDISDFFDSSISTLPTEVAECDGEIPDHDVSGVFDPFNTHLAPAAPPSSDTSLVSLGEFVKVRVVSVPSPTFTRYMS